LWFDSGWPPALADVKGKYVGYVFYLDPGDKRRPDPSKATLDAYLAAGLDLAMLWQHAKVDVAAGGFALGADHAKRANADADKKGAGAWEPILYAVDDNRTYAQVEQYFRGVLSVPGRPVGAYGGGDLIDALYDNLGIRWFMEAGAKAWDHALDYVSPRSQFWQRDPNVPVGNSAVDQVVQLAQYPTRKTGPMATYPDLTANAPFTQASKTSAGSNSPVNRLVVHHTVSKTQRGGAQATANGFASSAAGGSAHYTVDPGAVVQSVKESVIAWHAPPNSNSIGVEMTDLCIWQAYPSSNAGQLDSRFAGNEGAFHARWSLPDWQQMLARTAIVFRNLADKFSVPLVRLSVADLAAGKRGICGHREVSLWKKQSSHIDPYACDSCSGDFPWGQFMDMVANPDKAVAIIGGTIITPPEDDMPFTSDQIAQLVRDNTATTPMFLVRLRDDPTGAVWLSNLVTRRWVVSYDDLVSIFHWFDQCHITDKTVYDVDRLDFYGAVVGPNPPAAKSLRESDAPALGDEEIARAQSGVPNEESSPGVHGAHDTESLEG
jgi:hypothetical protein